MDTTGAPRSGDSRFALVANVRLGAAFATRGGYHVAYWRKQDGRRFLLGPPASNVLVGTLKNGSGRQQHDDISRIQYFEHGTLCWTPPLGPFGPAQTILNERSERVM